MVTWDWSVCVCVLYMCGTAGDLHGSLREWISGDVL